MKKFLKILISLIILVILGVVAYRYQATIHARLSPVLSAISTQINSVSLPCANPISYSIGSFDTKFGISQSYFLNALTDAEAIWEKPFGRELFTNTENGDLKINLIYDDRQEATTKLASLGITVTDNRATYDTLKVKFTDLKLNLTAAKNDYEAQVQIFNNRQKIYEDLVQHWNAQGGAPKDVYDSLQVEKSVLDSQSSQLQGRQAQINEMVAEINAVVVVLNRLADTLNISVDNYNTVGSARGESFEEGVYISDGINRQIDIYEYSSRVKLVRVLAHELGHALGLPHVDDPKAIMYKLNQSNNEILTTADLAVLKTKCGTK